MELVVSKGILFCNACREELCLKASVLKSHVQSIREAYTEKRAAGS